MNWDRGRTRAEQGGRERTTPPIGRPLRARARVWYLPLGADYVDDCAACAARNGIEPRQRNWAVRGVCTEHGEFGCHHHRRRGLTDLVERYAPAQSPTERVLKSIRA